MTNSNRKDTTLGETDKEDPAELIRDLKKQQEALRSANEGLAVFEEELRVQNEELIAAQKALNRERERYRGIFDKAPIGYVVTDADGNIQEANQAAARLFGSSLEGRRFSDLVPAIGREENSKQWEGLVLPLSGSPFWAALTSAAHRDHAGNILSMLWLVRDITDRKRAEDALRENEVRLRKLAFALTSAEQRERQRIAKILHDHIQQLLVAAKMQTSTLLNRQPNEDLESTAKLVYEMLSQTLSASRSLTTELTPPVLNDIGLGPALQWLARNLLEKHGLKVEMAFDPQAEPRIEELRIFLFDAVREILFNTIKHSGVTAARVECSRGADDLLHIVISDTGKGFDPTGIASGEKKTEGFGLFSIQQRLKHLGGRMEIRSNRYHGTQITIIGPPLPALKSEPSIEKQALPPVAEAPESGKIRVILADDHHIIRDGLARVLRSEPDIDVVGEAANGVQAINLARLLHPDVLVMDVSMPVLNGVEATVEVHRDMPDIKIIGLSMHEEGELSSAIRHAGAVAYVTKGGPPEALITAIRKVANGLSEM